MTPTLFNKSRAKLFLKAVLPAATRNILRHIAYCANNPKVLLRRLGVLGAAHFTLLPAWHELKRLSSSRIASAEYFLTARDSAFPLRCRVASSDLDVFRQIFVEREYECVDNLHEPEFMLDCGANVGFASAWFLSRYPTLQVVAVEPDSANAHAARKNLAPFGKRCAVRESGVWSSATRLSVVRGQFGDGREWAIQVRESNDGEPHDLIAVDIPTLIRDAGTDRVSVLKIDIEGAEGEVFGRATTWLDLVDNLVIEIHGPELATVVEAAIPSQQFTRSRSGELTCFRRVAPPDKV